MFAKVSIQSHSLDKKHLVNPKSPQLFPRSAGNEKKNNNNSSRQDRCFSRHFSSIYRSAKSNKYRTALNYASSIMSQGCAAAVGRTRISTSPSLKRRFRIGRSFTGIDQRSEKLCPGRRVDCLEKLCKGCLFDERTLQK